MKFVHLKGTLDRNVANFAHPHLECDPLGAPEISVKVRYSAVWQLATS